MKSGIIKKNTLLFYPFFYFWLMTDIGVKKGDTIEIFL